MDNGNIKEIIVLIIIYIFGISNIFVLEDFFFFVVIFKGFFIFIIKGMIFGIVKNKCMKCMVVRFIVYSFIS